MTGWLDVIIASDNPDKVREMQEILPGSRIRFRSMRLAGFNGEIREVGTTFAENALVKAQTVHAVTGGYVLADDSGLAVDVLDGGPGIYSARFAGVNASYTVKIRRLLELLRPWPPEKWLASFICVMALVLPDGSTELARGECRGLIAPQARGSGGFGYDPIFLLPERGLTMAELPPEEKHRISHRGQALRSMAEILLREIEPPGTA